jgi:hypothetical protein
LSAINKNFINIRIIDYFFNKFSLNLLFLLIFCFSFHEKITKYFYFYKEAISLIFLILAILYFFHFKLKFFETIVKNKIYIFFFPYTFLILIFIVNTGPIDIEFTKSSTFLNNDTSKTILLLYVIRNLIILMPVVLFFSLRGINENEQKKILLFFFIAGFVGYITNTIYEIYTNKYSIYNYLYWYNFFGHNNTYMPYISSIYAVSLYLLLNEKNNFNLIVFSAFSSILLFMIFLSSGKAAILFCIFVLIYFIMICKNKKKILLLLIGKIVILFFLHISINIYANFSYETNLEEIENFTKNNPTLEKHKKKKLEEGFIYPIFNKEVKRLDLRSRLDIYLSFLQYAKKTSPSDIEFYFGTGSLSSTFSGYHNDFMRIYYRVGIFGLFFSFIPFFYFFFKLLMLVINRKFFYKKNNQTDFVYMLLVLIGFNLYYSLFAYPRDDVYQSSTIWVGLILMYGYLNKKDKF